MNTKLVLDMSSNSILSSFCPLVPFDHLSRRGQQIRTVPTELQTSEQLVFSGTDSFKVDSFFASPIKGYLIHS